MLPRLLEMVEDMLAIQENEVRMLGHEFFIDKPALLNIILGFIIRSSYTLADSLHASTGDDIQQFEMQLL